MVNKRGKVVSKLRSAKGKKSSWAYLSLQAGEAIPVEGFQALGFVPFSGGEGKDMVVVGKHFTFLLIVV